MIDRGIAPSTDERRAGGKESISPASEWREAQNSSQPSVSREGSTLRTAADRPGA